MQIYSTPSTSVMAEWSPAYSLQGFIAAVRERVQSFLSSKNQAIELTWSLIGLRGAKIKAPGVGSLYYSACLYNMQ